MSQFPIDPDGAHGPVPSGSLPLLEDRGDPAHASDTITESGDVRVRVHVQPYYVDHASDPSERQYVFAYRVRITNEGNTTVQLLTRHWVFTDADGHPHEVRGEGVVGRQPRLHPGEGFTYESFVPMSTKWGTMEGRFHFEIGEGPETGAPVEVRIDRCYLVAA
ncbi:MAG: hypothetical protein Tsb0013_17450 [Phycisphaerales bacterium]